jgi:hypothetical protein
VQYVSAENDAERTGKGEVWQIQKNAGMQPVLALLLKKRSIAATTARALAANWRSSASAAMPIAA